MKNQQLRKSAALAIDSIDWHISRCKEGLIEYCPQKVRTKCAERLGMRGADVTFWVLVETRSCK